MATSGGRQTTMWPAPRCETCGCPLLVWLRPEQVAEALQVSSRHIRNLCHRGHLDYCRLSEAERRYVMRVNHYSLHDYLGEGGPDPDWWVEMEQMETI